MRRTASCVENPARAVCLRDDHLARAGRAGPEDARHAAVRPGERIRSVQLYGVDPMIMADATRILINEYAVAHVDLNFGCPVPKVTRKGGGAALPWKRDRLRQILQATVRAAAPYGVPVTIKTRIGIDLDHQTYLDAGRIAEDAGCAAIALHGRTAQQAYAGHADWDAIAALKAHVDYPRSRQRRHLGGRRRAADGDRDRGRRCGDRPRLPRPAVAVRRPGRLPLRGARPACCPRSARWRRSSAGTPSCSPA